MTVLPLSWDVLRVNAREVYWTYPDPVTGQPGRTIQLPKWTLTVHTVTCRYAAASDGYRSDGAVLLLRDRGYGPRTRYDHEVWRGCRTCGTATPDGEARVRAAVAEHIEALQAAAQRERERRAAAAEEERARASLAEAMDRAAAAYYEEHFRAAIEVVTAMERQRAAEQWAQDNPQQAALLMRLDKGREDREDS